MIRSIYYLPVSNKDGRFLFGTRHAGMIPSAAIGAICGQNLLKEGLSADDADGRRYLFDYNQKLCHFKLLLCNIIGASPMHRAAAGGLK